MKAILFTADEYKDEALSLAETAFYEIAKIYKIPKKPNPNFYIQKDKVEEIKKLNDIDAIIIFDLLKSRHFINLNKELLGKKILDKVILLLEIFALHAGSKEAKLQIELAKLKYELPILKDMYKKAKITEQQGPLGAGVYGVESTIRLYQRRIVKIRKELEEIKKAKEDQIRRVNFNSVAIVGYTNAGKTTIFNYLTGLNQKVDSSMFTTTSPKRYAIPIDGKKIMLVDTVGFIRGIPPQIIEAFFVTLSEAKYANALLLVLDSSLSSTLLVEMLQSSLEILRELGISGKPMIIALNKIDKNNEEKEVEDKVNLVKELANSLYTPIIDVIPVSALKGINMNILRDKILALI
ncbi:GTPase HflX [Sulfurisphaera ohwakuensis]|uniref:GTP-binding protein HflX n=1 Tax=Sulfurisphaera ohwakuensis TaxID=69656 RepID=A0A650CEI8_SULOH|nr:GTPase HflX [Sulfurisphaera ohwakuensis]MBB5253114.1 GTP-binding protein HflX [Sulfurisphaera ohwakuensis]QGR15967.1 GTPase HflX [Sulfurisphaera ohwakuensis]